ncbi:UNVERIFIED_CONTAM: dethiobiotin synthetase [Acetivibrio alkalicellulosi]
MLMCMFAKQTNGACIKPKAISERKLEMGKGIFILGTDTDVGKTFITAGINYILNKNNFRCCSFKPVQTGAFTFSGCRISGDMKFVKEMCSIEEDYVNMNSYCFIKEVSPHIAAELEDVRIDTKKIINDFNALKENYDYVIVEGAGGLIVPIIRNEYYMYDMIKDLNLSAILVSRAGIGTINHTSLTWEFAKSKGIDIKGIIVNGYNGLYYEDDNVDVIKSITGVPVISVMPKVKTDNTDDFIKQVQLQYEKNINIDEILKIFG